MEAGEVRWDLKLEVAEIEVGLDAVEVQTPCRGIICGRTREDGLGVAALLCTAP